MASSAVIWWGVRLSLLAGCIAVVALRLQHSLDGAGTENSSSSSSSRQRQATFCYQGVLTNVDPGPGGDDGSAAVNCFAVSGGAKFARVFSDSDSGSDSDSDLDPGTLEVRPGYALPGLWDGHGHLLQFGEFLHSADLFGSVSFDDIRSRLSRYLDANPAAGSADEWARGIGWDQMALGAMPTAAADERLKGRFFMLDRIDVHCTWVSQAILDLLPAHLPDVPGGEIVRTPGMGVFCDNAMDLVVALWPKPGIARKKTFIASAMKALHAVGLVGMHDAGVFPDDIAMYDAMSRTDDWTLRVYAMVECKERNTFCPDDATKISHDDGMLTARSVKLFADGALGSWGSAMIEPYSDRPDVTGSLLVNASTLTALTKAWSAAGFQVNIHAIGDLANRYAVDAMEAALVALCAPAAGADVDDLADCQARHHRFRIEHAQIIHPDDQLRMHALGIIPSVQPTHATSDMAYAERRLGAERTATEAYRMRSLLPLHPVLGSDFPVEPPNPFEGLYAAVTRKNPQTGVGPPSTEDGWHREEALSAEQALAGFTKGAARGAFLEGKAGVIREGAFADWIVLDAPLESISPEQLRHVKVRETWVAGKLVYKRRNDDAEHKDL
ncbi:amidohydrolase [Lasiosphaeria ovina]|uniref:Amidohydrolase n=1 Tax=Lasiosphaeria ovina TaxID=92902 RepID=A0AAE0TY77_9PEZI|nr:amidohydrolase [Lasiosphaeria ovina]